MFSQITFSGIQSINQTANKQDFKYLSISKFRLAKWMMSFISKKEFKKLSSHAKHNRKFIVISEALRTDSYRHHILILLITCREKH